MQAFRILYLFLYILGGATLLAQATAGQAATLYVATTGNDAHPGTATKPFRTLQKGVRALRAGDTLLVSGGTYREVLLNVIPSGTSWSQPVTVKAAPGAQVVIQAPTTADGVVAFVGPQTAYIILDGLTFDANRLASYAFSIDAGAHHIRVMNCTMKQSKASGLLVGPGQAPGTAGGCCNEMLNLDVYDNGSTGFHHGLYLASTKNIVEGSRFYRNAGYGIQNYNSYGGAHDNTLRGNHVYRNGSGGIWAGSQRHLISNNLVWDNGHGIILAGAGVKLYNNTIYGNQGTRHADGTIQDQGIGILILNANDVGTEIANNIAYRNPGGQLYGTRAAVLSNNLLGQDPLFVNAAQGNFHLQNSSPAIDAAKPTTLVPTDAEGLARPQGATYDIGAYEHRTTFIPPPPRNLHVN